MARIIGELANPVQPPARPWKVFATSHHAHDYRLELPHSAMPLERGSAQEYATASYIERAVNSHDILVAALSRLTTVCEGIWAIRSPDDALSEAREALRVAKEGVFP